MGDQEQPAGGRPSERGIPFGLVTRLASRDDIESDLTMWVSCLVLFCLPFFLEARSTIALVFLLCCCCYYVHPESCGGECHV